MAHLNSRADLCHVPTPAAVIDRLRAFLDIPEGCHVLDPCCGTGEALDSLAGRRGKTYGIELELARARSATKRLRRVLKGAMEDARVSHQTFGLMLLNPPYDDSLMGRLEHTFLRRCGEYLVGGGVLIFIIPESRYDQMIVRHLLTWYEDYRHWQFPVGLYDGPELAFKQTVLVCRRRKRPRLLDADQAKVAMKTELGLGSLEPFVPTLDKYKVPVGEEPDIFWQNMMDPEVMAGLLAKSTMPRLREERPLMIAGRPPLPLRIGHVAQVLASGLIDGVYGEGKTMHLARGCVRRAVSHKKKVDVTPSGTAIYTHIETDSFNTTIRALYADGRLENFGQVQAVSAEKAPVEYGTAEDAVEDEGDAEEAE